MQKNMQTKPNIVIIGGGTGTYVALMGLKKYAVNLTAIVTMMDNGGSSGKLRDELGVLPPGDVRQCLVALAESSELLRELFNYRFQEGDLKGHNFGNIFLSALEKISGSMDKAIEEVGEVLRIQGKVVPVTSSKADLCVEFEDGQTIIGETHIDEVSQNVNRPPIKKAFLKPVVTANQDALTAIKNADYIVIGPGDLYTSLVPNFLVQGITQAIKKSHAKKIFVLNLMTKYGQTTDYTGYKHIIDLEKYLGKNVLDFILVNTQKPIKEALAWYQEYNEILVQDDLPQDISYQVIRTSLLKNVMLEKSSSDSLKRSIIRHDSEQLAEAIMKLIKVNL
jgi:uncharacterized cofD-like protein